MGIDRNIAVTAAQARVQAATRAVARPFHLAGIGRTMFDAITGRDYVVVQGLTLVIALTFVTFNLHVDIRYGFVDPRVRAR